MAQPAAISIDEFVHESRFQNWDFHRRYVREHGEERARAWALTDVEQGEHWLDGLLTNEELYRLAWGLQVR